MNDTDSGVRQNGLRVFVIYGFGEGPRLAKRLQQELTCRGGQLVGSGAEADVILTHSAGCFEVPVKLPGKQVAIINPICGPAHRLPQMIAQKIWQDFVWHVRHGHGLAWLRKSAWNIWYIVARAGRNIRLVKKANRYATQLPVVTAQKVTVVNNQIDPWAKQVPRAEIAGHKYTFVTLPGAHDDLWLRPGNYLDILE